MDEQNQGNRHSGLILAGGVSVFVLLWISERYGLATLLSQRAVVTAFSTFGVNALIGNQQALHIGDLLISWSEDCSGINLAALLLGLILWSHWQRPGVAVWWRFSGVIPVFLICNLFRIGLIILYRWLACPNYESLPLHYLIGFFSIIPGVILLRIPLKIPAKEIPVLAAVLVAMALVSGSIHEPGGFWITLALGGLLQITLTAYHHDPPEFSALKTMIWTTAGGLLWVSGMDSLWLTWVLLMPNLFPWKPFPSPPRLLLLVGCSELSTLIPGYHWLIAGVVSWSLYRFFFREPSLPVHLNRPVPPMPAPRFTVMLIVTALFLPFFRPAFQSEASAKPSPEWSPVPLHDRTGYHVRWFDQTPDLLATWYPSTTGDRHHSVRICSRYQGKRLSRLARTRNAWKTGENLYREYFLIGPTVCKSYRDYVFTTLDPLAGKGAHLIFHARSRDVSEAFFVMETDRIIDEMEAGIHLSAASGSVDR